MLMIWAVATRWNTMATLLERALKLHEPLNLLVTLEQHNKNSHGVRLQRFKLSRQEWDLLTQLYPLLEVRLIDFVMHGEAEFMNRCFSRPRRKSQRAMHLFYTRSFPSSTSLAMLSMIMLMMKTSSLPFERLHVEATPY